MDRLRFTYLVEKFMKGTLSEAELVELDAALNAREDQSMQEQSMVNLIAASTFDAPAADPLEGRVHFEKIIAVDRVSKAKFRPLKRWIWAAASVLIILGLGIGIVLYNSFEKSQIAIVQVDKSAPTLNRANITLADGSQLFLDSLDSGQLAALGNIKLVKLANGQIAYQAADGKMMTELQYNELSNPKGSSPIDIRLSDGTHVWLNAGSSLRYPVAFVEGTRQVELKGEGYFEVAKDPGRRFIVEADATQTEVLGTHFNINAFAAGTPVRVTLLEGAVQVTKATSLLKLKRGQQAITADAGLKLDPDPDLEEVMSWKQGEFIFNNADINTIMGELSRWYDVEVEFRGAKPTGRYAAMISRKTNLSEVLKMLELSGLKAQWENGKIIVSK